MAGGYDVQFVEEPADSCICPICHLGMKEPQITLCGHQFCGDCLGALIRDDKLSCPVCRTELTNAQFFPNNALKREVLNLKIRCNLHKEGCGWVAELSQREAHIPTCLFVTVPCSNQCGEWIRRKDVEDHLSKECKLRDVTCPHCHEVMKFPDLNHHEEESCQYVPKPCSNGCKKMVRGKDIAHHEKKCPCATVTCPNDCSAEFLRKHLSRHLSTECERRTVDCTHCNKEMEQWKLRGHLNSCLEYTIPCIYDCGKQVARRRMRDHVSKHGSCPSCPLECDFSKSGCHFKGKRNELKRHLLRNDSTHLSLVMNVVRTQEEELRSTRAALVRRQSEINYMKAEFEARLPEWKLPELNEFVHLWKIDGWSNKLKDARSGAVTRLTSGSLYTDHPGYRIFFGIFPNGLRSHRGSHVSISPYLETGEYDEVLPWPVCGKFKIMVIDQQFGGEDQSVLYEKECRPGSSYLGGVLDLVSHSRLRTRLFVKNDSILLKLCVKFEEE